MMLNLFRNPIVWLDSQNYFEDTNAVHHLALKLHFLAKARHQQHHEWAFLDENHSSLPTQHMTRMEINLVMAPSLGVVNQQTSSSLRSNNLYETRMAVRDFKGKIKP